MKYQALLFLSCILSVEGFWGGESRIEPHAEISTECTLNHAARGSCEFFRCLEDRFPCGHAGFTRDMMLFVCDRVNTNMHRLNAKGQRWMNKTMQCMTQSLLPVYNAYASRCGDIRDAGIDAMSTCQNTVDDAGTDFCTFVTENFQPYQDIFGVQVFRKMLRFRNRGMVVPFVSDIARCGVGEFQARASRFMQTLEGIIETALAAVVDRWERFWN